MKFTKSIVLFFLLFFFSLNTCFAEGQTGMAEFYMVLYSLTFCFYILTIGGVILLTRKWLGFKNSKTVKWIAFGIGFLLSVLFYLIDNFSSTPDKL